MKNLLLLILALFICSCSLGPSRVAPSVSTNSISGPFFKKILSRTVSIPIPQAYSFKFGGDWSMRQDVFSLEEKVMAFTFVKENEEISLRGGMKDFLYKDSSFTIEKDSPDEAFVRYYLKWDLDYAASRHDIIQQAEVYGPIYDREKKFGYVKATNGNYQRCVLAAVVDGSIYMMTGKAMDSKTDVCNTAIEIWESRESF